MDSVHTELTELIAWARASNFTYWRKMIAQLFWLQGVHQTPDTLHTISSLISVLHMQPNTTKCLTLSTIVSNYTNTLYAAFVDHLQLENAQIDPSHKISLPVKQANARTNSSTLHITKTLWYYSKSDSRISPISRPYFLLMSQIILTRQPSPKNSKIPSNDPLEKLTTSWLTSAAENSVANQNHY
jgi:hypothetical protein